MNNSHVMEGDLSLSFANNINIPKVAQIMALPSLEEVEYLNQEYEQHKVTSKISPCSEKRQRRLSVLRHGKHSGCDIAVEKQLHFAVNKEDYESVQQLLQSGLDPSCHDDRQRTPLHFAASRGNHALVKLLLQHKADPNKCDGIGNTPLHLAACTSHISVVTELLKAGTDLQAIDNCGRTPLKLARSRLKILYSDRSCTSGNLKEEVSKVVDMMHTYLSLSHQQTDLDQLDRLSTQLSSASTREQMDELGGLLDKFTNLTLEKGHRGIM